MGGLSRKRTRPRIVKKTRKPSAKAKFNLHALSAPLK